MMENRALHRFALAVAFATLFLVVAGALVTSNDAGLSVPDWPLSYGRLMPEMTGGIFYEHGHRMVATTVGFLTVILAFWLSRAESRGWMRKLGWTALAAVIAQGTLGGMTVIFMLPKAVSISHACLAQLFFSTICSIALFTSPAWGRGGAIVEDSGAPSLRTLAVVAPASVFVQLALGAAARHKLAGSLVHIAWAPVATALVVWFVAQILVKHSSHDQLRKPALALLGIVLAQVFLGIAAYMSRLATIDAPQPMPVMVGFTVAHVAVGALTLALSILASIQTFRYVRRAAEAHVVPEAAGARS